MAIDPPPMPIELTETEGMNSGNSPISSPAPNCGWPSTIRAKSAEVPPMSRVSTRFSPACLASQAAPMTPDAVPESSMLTHARLPSAAFIRPPFDRVSIGRAGTSRPASRASSAPR